jgi:diacylglycerol kinase family enzyme
MGIDVVLNRNAGRLRDGGALRATLLGAAKAHGARTHETRTLAELDEVARELAARGTDAVVLAGGDGSYMAGVTALARAFDDALPPVALAPGGTVGIIARNVGLHGSARAWVDRVVAAAAEPAARVPTRAHPTLRVADGTGADRVAFIFGAGLVAGFFGEYYVEGEPQDMARAAAMAARVFAGAVVGSGLARRVLAPVACRLAIDGVDRPGDGWSLVLASVVRDVGLHVHATYRAGEAHDRFHVVASGLSPRGLASQVPRVLTGRAMRGEHHVDALAASLDVRFETEGAYVLDGDVLRARTVRVTPGPVFRLIVPL